MSIRTSSWARLVVLFSAVVVPVSATQFYVAPDGAPGNSGSRSRPWDLATAFSQPRSVQPGDTIWLRGGRYPLSETLVSSLRGTTGNPILVRQVHGERATMDCSGVTRLRAGADCLLLQSRHTWYWGFELTNSSPARWASKPGAPADPRGIGIHSQAGPGTKLINLVIHDVGTTLFESQPSGIEITGLIAYNTGWDGPDRSHGPGFYIRNRTDWPAKLIRDNIVFQHYRQALQGYGSFNNVFSNFVVEGNVFFNNGIGADGPHRNLMFGNANTEHVNNAFLDNHTYYPSEGSHGSNMFAAPEGGCRGLLLAGNVFAHGPDRKAIEINRCHDVKMRRNIVHGRTLLQDVEGGSVSDDEFETRFPDNRYLRSEKDLPGAPLVSLRRNLYEPNRAHLIVHNWAEDCSVSIDLSPLDIPPGARYELRSVQDYFGPALSGVYRGKDIEVPMQGWGVARPIGAFAGALPEALPRFGAFVLTWRTRPWTDRRRLSALRLGSIGNSLAFACAKSPSQHADSANIDTGL